MKKQNFHISGPDYDYLANAGGHKGSSDKLEINPSYATLPHEKSTTNVTSPNKPPRPGSILSRDKSKLHYRTSF